ncbi:hypothetical protein IWW50_001125 [Coemansia erecta]|nr:hypothetical protein IWW50_001125 [Coemansia erecta]
MAARLEQEYTRLPEDESAAEPLQVLYEDKYLLVSTKALVIKRYYFPSMGSRAIPWSKIEWVRMARDADVKWYALKEWGMGVGTIWWNCKARLITRDRDSCCGLKVNGMAAIRATNIVVKVKGACIRPGSYVDRPEPAMAAIGRLIYRNHSHVD